MGLAPVERAGLTFDESAQTRLAIKAGDGKPAVQVLDKGETGPLTGVAQ